MFLKNFCTFSNNCQRFFHTSFVNRAVKNVRKTRDPERARRLMHYVTAAGVTVTGLAYAAVPLYRIFCQATSYGGTTKKDADRIEFIKPMKDRTLRIKFNADTSSQLQWNFKPQQSSVTVAPGETALVFYTAQNPTDKPVIGVSSYNVVPFEAGQYFNKIQCFCFEEQMLNPHEEVDMPVFFYVDPEITEDPLLEDVSEIVLSYTFFQAKKGAKIPIPSYARKHTERET